MPLLVVVIQPPRRPIEDAADDSEVLVSQFGEERVGGGVEEVFSLARGEGAEGRLRGCRGGGDGGGIEEVWVHFDVSCRGSGIRDEKERKERKESAQFLIPTTSSTSPSYVSWVQRAETRST